jgi:rhamnogalacturonan endolyase
MMRYFLFTLLFSCFLLAIAQDPRERNYYYEVLQPRSEPKPVVQGFATERITEKLNRGLTAVKSSDGKSVFLSWRLLNSDDASVLFNIYKSAAGKTIRLNTKPIAISCNFTDTKPVGNAEYFVRPITGKKEGGPSEKINVNFEGLSNFISIKLKEGERVGKLAIADLNGDGYYDFIVRTPNSNVDPGMPPDTTGITYKVSAYLHDGTYLWTHDMGLGIEPGVWYSPFIAFDFNGDGKAEVAIKGAGSDFVRNEKYRIAGGSEYLLVLDGMTGEIIDRVDWPERNYRYGDVNRQNRNQIGMAYLDGKTPCILTARGTYKLMVVDAWQLNGTKLEKLWRWDGDEENPVIRSQGAHSMVCGDVDGDGRDEILLGSCMLNSNGTLRWSTGLGHSDKAYLTQVDPRRNGMQVFLVAEAWKDDGRGVSLYDANSGSLIWGIGHKTLHVGDGMVADIDHTSPGLECFASEDPKGGSSDKYLLTADGKKMDVPMNEIPGCRNWLWWDADLTRETIAFGSVTQEEGRRRRFTQNVVKWRGEKLTEGIEGEIQMIVDFNGDWREELITTLPGEIRIYQTAIPAIDRRVTLLQDPLYRSYILHRSMGYPQSPVPGYYLGN